MHNFKINSIYLPKMNLISLPSFELCCTQIYNAYRRTHARTQKTHILTQGAQKYRKSSKSRGRKISPLQSFLFEKAKTCQSKMVTVLRQDFFKSIIKVKLIGSRTSVFLASGLILQFSSYLYIQNLSQSFRRIRVPDASPSYS